MSNDKGPKADNAPIIIISLSLCWPVSEDWLVVAAVSALSIYDFPLYFYIDLGLKQLITQTYS
jgi:hypothetical protein